MFILSLLPSIIDCKDATLLIGKPPTNKSAQLELKKIDNLNAPSLTYSFTDQEAKNLYAYLKDFLGVE